MPCKRNTRFIAKLMAFIWLFSLAVSAAHACFISSSLEGAIQVQASSPAAAHDGQEPSACPQACKSFCDSERSTVTKTQSAKTVDLSDSALWLGSARAWRLQTVARADDAAAWQQAAAPPRQLALAIQYLRLTL
jgi:hypothetical protein